MAQVSGLHHITVIAGHPQENLDFYSGVLGMRLVKKSVNQDATDTYHLFYADAAGSPGTDLTFFPWPKLPAGRNGPGMATEVCLAIPPASLSYWQQRLNAHAVVTLPVLHRFGEKALPFAGPHGLGLALVEAPVRTDFAPWADSPVPQDRQISGLHAARLCESTLSAPNAVLTEAMGFRKIAEDAGWVRMACGDGISGTFVDVLADPAAPRGQQGMGSVHHVAFRVADPDALLEVRERVLGAGVRPTPTIDRFWFKSVYFREPGGVLFELATDGPGFHIDEAADKLGERLILPPWLENRRAEIEAGLPSLTSPRTSE